MPLSADMDYILGLKKDEHMYVLFVWGVMPRLASPLSQGGYDRES